MEEEEGIVLAIAGNKATVQIESGQQGCSHCPHKCETQDGKILLDADNSMGVEVGQKVRLQTLSQIRIGGAILFFILPTLVIVGGIGGGIYLASRWGFSQKTGELMGIASGLILTGIIYSLAYLSRNRLKRNIYHISLIKPIL